MKRFAAITLLLFMCATVVYAVVTWVQGVEGTYNNSGASCGGAGPCILNITLNGYTSGNTVTWGAVTNANTGITPTVNSGGSCTTRATDTSNNYSVVGGECTGMATGNPVLTFTGTATFRVSAVVDEFSGLSGFDAASTWAVPFTTQDGITTNPATTTANGDLCYMIGVDQAAQGGTPAATAPFTYRTGTAGVNIFPIVSASYVQPSLGGITGAWTGFGGAAKPAAVLICYTATGGGGGGGSSGSAVSRPVPMPLQTPAAAQRPASTQNPGPRQVPR